MPNDSEIAQSFLQFATRRPQFHGKWMPVEYWSHKIQAKINMEGLKPSKIIKILEQQGILNAVLDEYGGIHVEILSRKVLVDSLVPKKRHFICISSPDKPETSTENPATLGSVLQDAWNTFSSQRPQQQQERPDHPEKQEQQHDGEIDDDVQPTISPTEDYHSPLIQSRVTPPTTIASPVLQEDDLLGLFRSLINPKYLTADDLFIDSSSPADVRIKLQAFGKKIAGSTNSHHYQRCRRLFKDEADVEFEREKIQDIDQNDYPFFTNRCHIPLTLSAMRDLTQSLVNLAERVPEVLYLNKYAGSKGEGGRLVAIIPSADKKRLYYNAGMWMESVVAAAVYDDGKSKLDTYDVVNVLLRVLRTIDETAFEDLAVATLSEHSESYRSRLKIDPELQLAMITKAGIKAHQMRTIKSYLCYSGLDIFHPEYVVNKLRVSEFEQPTSILFKDGGHRKRVAWYIPVDSLLTRSIDKNLEAASFSYDKLMTCHIILVGDHGAGAFRMMATALLITREQRRSRNSPVNQFIGTKLALEVDGLVGYIQCRKDTYAVLQSTITDHLNESIQRILALGSLSIFKDTNNVIRSMWGNPSVEKKVLATVPVEVFMTGDLAFYSIMLGKENMSPHWCWRCTSSKAEWTEGREGADLWSHNMLKNHLEALNASTEADRIKHRRGVTMPALLPSIPVQNILVPPLHNNELFVNHPIKELMKWIHCRIEKLPADLIQARLDVVDASIDYDKEMEELAHAKASHDLLETERKSLAPVRKKFRDSEHQEQYENIKQLCLESKSQIDALSKSCNAWNDRKRAAIAQVNTLLKNKEYGALSQPVRQRMEAMLESVYKIVRSAYHGGDFEGNHCRKFIRNAEKVMDDIQALLLEIPQEDRAADDYEIVRYCYAFQRLFQYFDLLIHFCQQSFGTLSDADMTDVRDLVGKLDRLWRRLFSTVPPKAHAWHHLVVDLERLRGLKHHQESKIEVAHQIGKRIDLLFRGITDIDKKIQCALRYHHTQQAPTVRKAQEAVAQDRSRKRKAPSSSTADESNSNNVRHLLDLPEICSQFPDLLELAKQDRIEARYRNSD